MLAHLADIKSLVSRWVSSFLMALKHKIGYLVPYS